MWVNNISKEFPEAHKAFSSLESVFSLRGEPITRSPICNVLKVVLDGQGYYIKRYHRSGKGLSGLLGKSKANREWSNLAQFKEWNLPVVELAAFGEESNSFVSGRGVVITKEVVNSIDLAELANNNPDKFKDRNWALNIIAQVAQASQIMHEHQFAHNDWKWRNILMVEEEFPKIHMIDCPSGMFWPGFLFEYRRIKDLACLDKVGVKVLSRTQRLKFYFLYANINKLKAIDKKIIFKIITFFQGRE